jgi:hypothetical protein
VAGRPVAVALGGAVNYERRASRTVRSVRTKQLCDQHWQLAILRQLPQARGRYVLPGGHQAGRGCLDLGTVWDRFVVLCL